MNYTHDLATKRGLFWQNWLFETKKTFFSQLPTKYTPTDLAEWISGDVLLFYIFSATNFSLTNWIELKPLKINLFEIYVFRVGCMNILKYIFRSSKFSLMVAWKSENALTDNIWIHFDRFECVKVMNIIVFQQIWLRETLEIFFTFFHWSKFILKVLNSWPGISDYAACSYWNVKQ